MATQVITTNLNLEDEARVIKSLESKIAELKELKDERIALVKEIMNKGNSGKACFFIRYMDITSHFQVTKF